MVKKKIEEYINNWKDKGYPEDIPDEVPIRIEDLNFAPSYRAIAIAILKNDHHLTSLGFKAPSSEWYGILKRIEIEEREK